jgi:hypothetical protein
MSFHTFGDSHALAGWERIPGVITHSPGPITAYAVGRDGLAKMDIRGFVKPGDSICFCVGEIDCRAHIHKYVTDHCPVEWVTGRVVSEYLNTIDQNMKLVEGVTAYLYSVPPAARSAGLNNDPQFPFVGTDNERAICVKYFNDMQFYHGSFYGFKAFNVWDHYRDNEMLLDRGFSRDGVHIHDPVHIIKTLHALGIVP